MPTATLVPPPTPARCSGALAHRVVAVDLRDGAADALGRVVTLLQRRRCRVTRVDYVAADRHRPGRLVLGYDAPPAHADRSLQWLAALVDVLSVEPLDG